MTDDQDKRRIISQLMREAASIFSETSSTDIAPALPKMYEAVLLAEQLDDKTPLLICQANLAWMNAVCGKPAESIEHIERAIEVAMENEMAVPIRNFAFIKFVEIAVLLGREHERALTYARALVQSAVDEEANYQQFLAALFNLAVVCQDLIRSPDWSVAILSWIIDESMPSDHHIAQQARTLYRKIIQRFPPETRHTWLSELEANRDYLLEQSTDGFLPQFAPNPPESSEWGENDNPDREF